MLLDLTAARLEGRVISASSLCIAASVPFTTALRCIDSLIAKGLLCRRRDAVDRRLRIIELTAIGWEAMRDYLVRIGMWLPAEVALIDHEQRK